MTSPSSEPDAQKVKTEMLRLAEHLYEEEYISKPQVYSGIAQATKELEDKGWMSYDQ